MLGDMPDGSMNGRVLVPVPKGLAGPEGALPTLPKGLTGFGAPRCWPVHSKGEFSNRFRVLGADDQPRHARHCLRLTARHEHRHDNTWHSTVCC